MTHAQSAIRIETLAYKHDGLECRGTFVYDGAATDRRPGVLLVPTFWGLDANARRKAVQVARLGYAVLALDLYGDGRAAQDRDEASRLMKDLARDRAVLRARAAAGLKALRYQRVVDGARLAAIGFCFGGQVALELARSGAELRGVVSFHGLLDADPKAPCAVKAKVLALHGAEDPLVPPRQAEAFRAEMSAAGADWQMVYYGGAVHGFTNPDAGADRKTGIAYDERADQRSWQAMRAFFDEVLG